LQLANLFLYMYTATKLLKITVKSLVYMYSISFYFD
jgi:hypothetical protein